MGFGENLSRPVGDIVGSAGSNPADSAEQLDRETLLAEPDLGAVTQAMRRVIHPLYPQRQTSHTQSQHDD